MDRSKVLVVIIAFIALFTMVLTLSLWYSFKDYGRRPLERTVKVFAVPPPASLRAAPLLGNPEPTDWLAMKALFPVQSSGPGAQTQVLEVLTRALPGEQVASMTWSPQPRVNTPEDEEYHNVSRTSPPPLPHSHEPSALPSSTHRILRGDRRMFSEGGDGAEGSDPVSREHALVRGVIEETVSHYENPTRADELRKAMKALAEAYERHLEQEVVPVRPYRRDIDMGKGIRIAVSPSRASVHGTPSVGAHSKTDSRNLMQEDKDDAAFLRHAFGEDTDELVPRRQSSGRSSTAPAEHNLSPLLEYPADYSDEYN